MNAEVRIDRPRRLRGGLAGGLMIGVIIASAGWFLYAFYVQAHISQDYATDLPFRHAMFGPGIEQPVAFSHRLHVTDKEIDCYYCHPYPGRSINSGMPAVSKCLACHDHIIPQHSEIVKLKGYQTRGEEIPWVRVYYNPDHVYFPHYRHILSDIRCQQCHGDIERSDRLRQVTYYMGFCLACHKESEAPLDCAACHQ